MEDKIEVGEYVRDKEGTIIKVNNIVLDEDSEDIWYEEEILEGTWKSMMVKHSKNIIDLIEVGDYVNGVYVDNIRNEINGDGKYEKAVIVNEMGYNEYAETLFNKDIKTILTKEQFASIEYKVKED